MSEKTRYVNALERFKGKEINENNKALALSYLREGRALGKKSATLRKYLSTIERAVEFFEPKPLKDVGKEDFIDFISNVEESGLCEEYKAAMKIRVKAFWRWLYGLEKYEGFPKPVAWITTNGGAFRQKLPEEILTEEEVFKAIDLMPSVRNKALFAVAYDTGARPHELIALKIRNVERGKDGMAITLPHAELKTGQRRLKLKPATPYLNMWLNSHPFKGDFNAPLFVTKYSKTEKTAFSYDGFRGVLAENKKYFKEAGVTKRLYPYIFRHSRATFYANIMTEAQMCYFFGWVQGSRIARRYVHLSGRDLDDSIEVAYGGKPREKQVGREPKKCPICLEENPPEALYCFKCARPISEEAESIDETVTEKEKLAAEIKEKVYQEIISEMKERGQK